MPDFQPGEQVWWQARTGRVRVPQSLLCRVVRIARTRVVVQPLSFTDPAADHPDWTPQHVKPESLTRRAMKHDVFTLAVAKACVLYATGANGYEEHMDSVSGIATEAQWENLCDIIERTDEWMVDAGKGSIYQLETVAARRERRRSRYPGVFSRGTPEADAAIAALEREYTGATR